MAKNDFERDCLNENVLTGKRWQNSIKRFKKLSEKFEETISERIEEELKITKMLLKCAKRLINEGVHDTLETEIELRKLQSFQVMSM